MEFHADSCSVSKTLDDVHMLQRPLKTYSINNIHPSSFKLCSTSYSFYYEKLYFFSTYVNSTHSTWLYKTI
jgi:hypothetical protein